MSAQRNIVSITSYNLESTPYGFILDTNNFGCMRIFGFIFMLPGLFVIAAALQIIGVKTPPPGTGEWAVLLLMGMAFAAFGGGIAFYRGYLVIDLRQQKITKIQGIFRLKNQTSFPVDDVKELFVSRMTVPSSDGPDDIVFAVMFLRKNGQDFPVGYYREMNEALRVSGEIAPRMGLKVFDTTVDGRPEINMSTKRETLSENQDRTFLPEPSSRYTYQNAPFKWDGHTASLSKLYTAKQNGVSFYKIQYPKFLIQRAIVALAGAGFVFYFFGWSLDTAIPKIFSGYLNPEFLTSVEVFFTTIFGTFFILFLFCPIIAVIIQAILPAKYCIVGVGSDGLYLHAPKPFTLGRRRKRKPFSHQLIRYTDIQGMDIKAKTETKDRKVWKSEKANNFIGLRVGTDFYEVGCGLDIQQLQLIADDIKAHMR